MAAIGGAIDDGLAYERTRDDMSSSKDRPARCTAARARRAPCAATPSGPSSTRRYKVDYCPTCQTGGKVLADNTTSKFLK